MEREELFAISFSLKQKPMQDPLSLLLLLKAVQGKMVKAMLKGEKDSRIITQDVVISIERPEGKDGSAVKGLTHNQNTKAQRIYQEFGKLK